MEVYTKIFEVNFIPVHIDLLKHVHCRNSNRFLCKAPHTIWTRFKICNFSL